MEENVKKSTETQPSVEEMQKKLIDMADAYNKLKDAANNQIQQMNMANTFQRLNYLFKVLEHSTHFNSEFIVSCVSEIQELMTIPEEPDTNDK